MKENRIIITIILVGIFIAGVTMFKDSSAANLFNVQTDSGTVGISTIMNLKGDGFIKTSVNGSNIIFSHHSLVAVGSLNQYNWDGSIKTLYYSDNFELSSDNPDYVAHVQPFNGLYDRITLNAVINHLNHPITFTLYDNNQATSDTFTLNPGQTNTAITVNQPLKQGDVLYWKATTTNTAQNAFRFNVETVINYVE